MDTLAEYVRQNAADMPFGVELTKASKSTIWAILDDDTIKPHRIRYYLEKKDSDFSAKCREVLLLYKHVEMQIAFKRYPGKLVTTERFSICVVRLEARHPSNREHSSG